MAKKVTKVIGSPEDFTRKDEIGWQTNAEDYGKSKYDQQLTKQYFENNQYQNLREQKRADEIKNIAGIFLITIVVILSIFFVLKYLKKKE